MAANIKAAYLESLAYINYLTPAVAVYCGVADGAAAGLGAVG